MITSTRLKEQLLLVPGVKRAWRQFMQIRRGAYERLGSDRYSRPGMLKLDQYINFRGGFYIEVGAHDGFSQSNTYHLEKFMGWTGVLVEGIPELYRQCKRHRPNSKVFNFALVDQTFTQPTVEMHFASLMSVVDGSLKSSDLQQQHLKTGVKHEQLRSSYTVHVPARTLESVLDAVQPPKIDLFSLDVEGYELSVLRGMNILKYQPRIIVVEARFFNEVNAFLAPYYDMVEQLWEHDYLYRLKSN